MDEWFPPQCGEIKLVTVSPEAADKAVENASEEDKCNK